MMLLCVCAETVLSEVSHMLRDRPMRIHTVLFATESMLVDAFLARLAILSAGSQRYLCNQSVITRTCHSIVVFLTVSRKYSLADIAEAQLLADQPGFSERDEKVCIVWFCNPLSFLT